MTTNRRSFSTAMTAGADEPEIASNIPATDDDGDDDESVVVAAAPPLPKVLIIGAGFSGLAVAYRLRNVADCRIIEARDRVGGRVHSVTLSDDCTVELGGQWIHEASAKNPIVRLMKEELNIPLLYATTTAGTTTGTTTATTTTTMVSDTSNAKKEKKIATKQNHRFRQIVCDTEGQPIPTAIYKAASKFLYKVIQSVSSKRKIRLDIPFQHDLDQALTDVAYSSQNKYYHRLGGVDPANPLFRAVLNCLVHRVECHEGGRFSELSAYLNNKYEMLGGPDEIPVGGYGAVVQAIVDRIGPERILFNKPVRTIDTTGTSTSSNSMDDNDNHNEGKEGITTATAAAVQITCHDGTIFSGDYCVCTVPLGVLQHRAIQFRPDLSPERWQALDTIGMGLLDKVILRFDECFWKKKNEDGGYEGIGVAHEDITRVQQFSDCSIDFGGAPVLVMFMGGDAARRVDTINGLSDEEITDEAMQSLRLIFGRDIPNPTKVMVTRWLQGSYSFTKIGCTEATYHQVAEPDVGERLFFAGEHTSVSAHSCVHGAWSTGEREASRLKVLIEQRSKLEQRITGSRAQSTST
jgi:monoamine oxidase